MDDGEVLAKAREEIAVFVERACAGRSDLEKISLRQLAWQGLDLLARGRSVSTLERDQVVLRLKAQAKKMGVSDGFIEKSLELAKKIYKSLQINYPGLMDRYGGRG